MMFTEISTNFQPLFYHSLWLALIFIASFYASTALSLGIGLLASLAQLLPLFEASKGESWANALVYLIAGTVLSLVFGAVRRDRIRAFEVQERLAQQDAILGTVLASVPILTLDDAGLILHSNGAAAELFGLTEETITGQAFQTFVPAFDPLNPAQAVEGDWQGQRADQTTFPLSIQHSTIPGLGGTKYMALHLNDQTRWHAADAQARELHAQLNKVWRLNSLGEMAATLAHELNQPLSAAATYLHASQSETERLGKLGENANRTCGLAKEQLLRAGQIIRRMRDLLSLEVRSLDRDQASSMVEDLSPVLTMIASAKGVKIKLEMDSDQDTVRADRIQFQQAIVNLVRNSVEATCNCPNALVVVSGQAVSDSAYQIVVADNGPGLPPEEVERMFQPMTSTKSGGMGLGLSVTRTIVERHGGRLNVAQSASGGAAFSFNLIRDPLDGDL